MFGIAPQPWEDPPEMSIAVNQQLIPVSVRRIPNTSSTPEGMVSVEFMVLGHKIAQRHVPPERLPMFKALLRHPVQTVLAAHEDDPGIQARLLAMVPASLAKKYVDEADSKDEPWKASIPSFEDSGPETNPEGFAPMLLGHAVRMQKDRRFPGSLDAETANLFQSILSGKGKNLVDKFLEDL